MHQISVSRPLSLKSTKSTLITFIRLFVPIIDLSSNRSCISLWGLCFLPFFSIHHSRCIYYNTQSLMVLFLLNKPSFQKLNFFRATIKWVCRVMLNGWVVNNLTLFFTLRPFGSLVSRLFSSFTVMWHKNLINGCTGFSVWIDLVFHHHHPGGDIPHLG